MPWSVGSIVEVCVCFWSMIDRMKHAEKPVKASVCAAQPSETVVSARPPKNPKLLADLVVRQGKTFKESALAAGYSQSFACGGLKAACDDSSTVSGAIQAASGALFTDINKLKPLAINRLYLEIANTKSIGGLKAIEIAGRFRETDWFVRNVETNLGIFVNLQETQPDHTLNVSDKFKE